MSVTGGGPLRVDLVNEAIQQLEYWTPTPQLDDDTKKSSKELCAIHQRPEMGIRDTRARGAETTTVLALFGEIHNSNWSLTM